MDVHLYYLLLQNEVGICFAEEKQLSDAKMFLSLLRPTLDACFFLYEGASSFKENAVEG